MGIVAIWSGLCKLRFRALASRRPARAAPRHEQDTYSPYRDALLQMKVDFKTFFKTDRRDGRAVDPLVFTFETIMHWTSHFGWHQIKDRPPKTSPALQAFESKHRLLYTEA